ncbi:AAA family ATPase [Rhizobium leguminosarum]|uniref:AAA family ATPase n=1 Tax=Rhizobium leguminosarum TaxID=384 RepID=UPI001C957FA8|nr:AAA family ATPase [Rhizobium leguminosarum]MBY5400953.1 ATP-binding protein [Rhizobium leguminosarum]
MPERGVPWTFALRYDNWDDFGFSTLFDLYYFDDSGKLQAIGEVKIMCRGQSIGTHHEFPSSEFEELTEDWCSLGQSQNYYETIYSLPGAIRQDLLLSLKDIAETPDIVAKFENEDAFKISLLRNVRQSDIAGIFHQILRGMAAPTPFNFEFNVPRGSSNGIKVKVTPQSLPPTNVHVLIGRNGVGKTRLLSGIVDQLTGRPLGSVSVEGAIVFPTKRRFEEKFTSLVSVAFSAFDQFTPVAKSQLKGDVKYSYIGLKKVSDEDDDTESMPNVELKTHRELENEFVESFMLCIKQPRFARWKKAIESLASDPVFADLDVEELASLPNPEIDVRALFAELSSGHKIILLTITRLVEVVEEKTLVLIDEPETHLHPPLLASFTNAISELLVNRNGVALVATHSPVVLQEVPMSCVTIVDRSGDRFAFEPPVSETYGENVGTLTREVFNLEVLRSGFHRRIEEELDKGDYEELIEKFSGQIGAEGRALARVINARKSKS